ncbi:hypothetical protein TRIUR3_27229 [Triticum urartu]|uniref:Uncharacterized protein n=1 Tax=Triticum urartu TaxID=4572 RepID=M7ZX03_TRIUA|nr:hypothetical protein TRIUR3_27229 [Triticum urartu]
MANNPNINLVGCHLFLQVKDELSFILKEQNAKCQREINTARVNVQADMIKFVDKLMTSISKSRYPSAS